MRSPVFSHKYSHVMELVWNHPHNDQRPSVLQWLRPLQRKFETVLDIGPGDAYYLNRLIPKNYTIVEPNCVLRGIALSRASTQGIKARAFSTIKGLFRNQPIKETDLVLLIHVLLYLRIEEIRILLPKIKNNPLVVVHPWPKLSTTVRFERALGFNDSCEKVNLKRQLLGRPECRKIVRSHLRLPHNTTAEDMAFLVAHRTLNGIHDSEIMNRAKQFVAKRICRWRRSNWYEIPQAQIQEYYNISRFL